MARTFHRMHVQFEPARREDGPDLVQNRQPASLAAAGIDHQGYSFGRQRRNSCRLSQETKSRSPSETCPFGGLT